MKTGFIIIGFIFFVILFILTVEINGRIKLKAMIKRNWGQFPASRRFDKEASLKESWLKAKEYQTYDSEIDDITWSDLDGFTLFERINTTYSSIGSEALYHCLRSFNFSMERSIRLEKLIDFYSENPEIREKIQFRFAGLGKKDNNMVESYLTEANNQKLPHTFIYVICGLLPIVLLPITLLFPSSFTLVFLLSSILFNVIYYQIKKEKLERELSCLGYLVQTIAVAKKLSKIATPFQSELKKNLKVIESITRFGISFRVKSMSEAELFFDYLSMIVMLPFISYNFVLSKLMNHENEAKEVWRLLGELEMAIAVLNFRIVMPDTCQPVFSKDKTVQGEEVYHPLLVDPIPNPVYWDQNTLVTGSNASGKSTYVKSIAISCMLSETIHTAIAATFQLPHGHVLTSMAVQDNIFVGDSYFIAEIKAMNRIIEKVKTEEICFCFVDEILKGTNTIERIAASSSIVYWLNKQNSLVFVATHDIELTEILKKVCTNIHFEEQVTKENGVTFDYLLREGPSETKNAIKLLEVLEYPKEIVDLAQSEAKYFDLHRTWEIISHK